jgi:hypothetical protein
MIAANELDELLRPVVSLTTVHDLRSADGCRRVAAGDVLARAQLGDKEWVRVWTADRSPQSGLTCTLAELGRSLDTALTLGWGCTGRKATV